MTNHHATARLTRRDLLTAASAGILAACSNTPAKTASRLERGGARGVLAPYVERGEVPGMVALVARGDREELHAMGTTAQGSRVAVEPDTIFRIASITKPVTATAAMMLIEDGKLGLDEPVARLLPELAHPRVLERLDGPLDRVVPAARAITVRDLLTFRMGAGLLFDPDRYPIEKVTQELLGDGMPAPAKLVAPDEWMRRFATLPLMHQPGERWMYNTSGIVLGILVGRAARMPLDAFLRERLFGPLGMHDTDFSVPASKLHRFTASYLADPGTGALSLYDSPNGQWAQPPLHASGAEGLVSTAPDFLRFSRFLLGRGTFGGKRLLSEAAVEQMTHDTLTPKNKTFGAMVPGYFDRHGWGFGMAVVTARDDDHMPAGSYGWDGGLGSSWYADPRTNTTGILLSSRSWTDPSPPRMFREFWRHVHA
ncbi:serine hydrolase domain-containing protein [Pendulispora albinea]|uniref:Beta-lactamase family protein n=1 Tax=Pendulispora albinea TaxID=2741071 RepID=A0ABZ2M7C0_9BACT